MKAMIREETVGKKKLIYRSPLTRKAQRCVHHRGRAGKVKRFTEEEIFLYLLRKVKSPFKIGTI